MSEVADDRDDVVEVGDVEPKDLSPPPRGEVVRSCVGWLLTWAFAAFGWALFVLGGYWQVGPLRGFLDRLFEVPPLLVLGALVLLPSMILTGLQMGGPLFWKRLRPLFIVGARLSATSIELYEQRPDYFCLPWHSANRLHQLDPATLEGFDDAAAEWVGLTHAGGVDFVPTRDERAREQVLGWLERRDLPRTQAD